MVSDSQRKLLEKRLAQIEKEIFDDNNKETANRMPAKFFMLFLLIGGSTELADLLQRKVQGLLSNPKACAFLNPNDNTDKTLGQQVDQVLQEAAKSYVDVKNLNTVLLCPILFAETYEKSSLEMTLGSVREYLSLTGKAPIWQPYLVLNGNLEYYSQTYNGVIDMETFVTGLPEGTVNRCCILSNQDENGFAVPVENILETIAVCSVLQNTKPENPDVAQVINRKVCADANDKNNRELFFTARSASVSNPVRSVTYQRMISAINFFSGDTDAESDDAMKRMNFHFIVELLEPYIGKLPHLDGQLSFFPLYGVMTGGSLHERLNQQINKYYREPLYGTAARESLSPAVRRRFFTMFFRNNGSLKELDDLIRTGTLENRMKQHVHECYGNHPMEIEPANKRDIQPFLIGEYKAARDCCEQLIKDAGNHFLSELISDLSDKKTLNAIDEVRQSLEAVRQCMMDRQRQLRDIEIVLGVGKTELYATFDAVQDNWFEYIARSDERMGQLNRRFDGMVCEMLLTSVEDFSEILRVCYDAVKDRIDTNAAYLQKLSDECAADPSKAAEFATAIEHSWCYTIRFIQRHAEEDVTCLIGDKENSFCQELQRRFNATHFEFHGFDKLGVLHVSAPFKAADLFAWNQIEAQGKKNAEVSH